MRPRDNYDSPLRRLTDPGGSDVRSIRRERMRSWKLCQHSRDMIGGYVADGRVVSARAGLELDLGPSKRLCQSDTQLRLVEALAIHATACLAIDMPVDYTLEQLVQIACDRHGIDHINGEPINRFRDSFLDRTGRPAGRFSLGIVEYTGRSGKGNLSATPSRLEPTGLIDLIDPSIAARYRENGWAREYVKRHPRPHHAPEPGPFDPATVSESELALRMNGYGAILLPYKGLEFDDGPVIP